MDKFHVSYRILLYAERLPHHGQCYRPFKLASSLARMLLLWKVGFVSFLFCYIGFRKILTSKFGIELLLHYYLCFAYPCQYAVIPARLRNLSLHGSGCEPVCCRNMALCNVLHRLQCLGVNCSLHHFNTLKVETEISYVTLASIYKATWRHIS
jgi:hypothetical protein